jgi:signal transduction histidine kinase
LDFLGAGRAGAALAGGTPGCSGNACEQLSIQIIDEGCGVPESEMQAIFEPFYESTRTATGAGGTGLGLALCKVIVQRHRGTLNVTNRPSGGAIFELCLPLVWSE